MYIIKILSKITLSGGVIMNNSMSLSRIKKTLMDTSNEIDTFRDFVSEKSSLAKNSDKGEIEKKHVIQLLNSLEKSETALMEYEKWKENKPAELDVVLTQKIHNAISFINDKTSQEKSGSLIVALNALQNFKVFLENEGAKDKSWLKRGLRTEGVDADQHEEK